MKRMLQGLAAMLAASLLSGCFIISLADGRSPFDDPFGPNAADIEQELPALSRALSGVDDVPKGWTLAAQVKYGNCEGLCDFRLHVAFQINKQVFEDATDEELEDYASEGTTQVAVDPEFFKRVVRATIPVATEANLDISYGEMFDRQQWIPESKDFQVKNSQGQEVNISAIVAAGETTDAVFGRDLGSSETDGRFSAGIDMLNAYTREHDDVLAVLEEYWQ